MNINQKITINMNSNFNIAILFGGLSSEREVSVNSAIEIYNALPDFLNVNLIELNHLNFSSFINELDKDTLVFNSLHGGEGENGQIQNYLSHHKISYTGSNANASMLAMNKHFTKIISFHSSIFSLHTNMRKQILV